MKPRNIDFSTVLASSVHDMKNSLCLLIQSIENLNQKLISNNIQESEELTQIHYEASRLNSNLLQVLSMYRAKKDMLPVNMDEFYLDDLIDELLSKNSFYAENRNIAVTTHIEDDLCWYFDNDLVFNLLNDIFVNAMRYCKNQILIEVNVVEEQLKVSISDDGDGYPEHMLISSNLEPFDVSLNESRTGLGIYFAQMIAYQHEQNGRTGSIKLENGGKLNGSVFTLSLP